MITTTASVRSAAARPDTACVCSLGAFVQFLESDLVLFIAVCTDVLCFLFFYHFLLLCKACTYRGAEPRGGEKFTQ